MKNYYAYIRVSTEQQNLDRQKEAIKEYFKENNIQKGSITFVADKESGKNFQRKGYELLKNKISRGDILIIHSIDRFGRNYDEILEEWRWFKRHDIDIIVLDMPILSTTTQVHGLDGRFISDVILQLLSYVAQKEREKIKERQAEGIRIAKEKGVRFGRPNKIITANHINVIKNYLNGIYSSTDEAIKLYGYSRGKFYKDLNLYKEKHLNDQ